MTATITKPQTKLSKSSVLLLLAFFVPPLVGGHASIAQSSTVERAVTTPDRLEQGNYGWVVFTDNTKQWVDSDCRDELQAATVELVAQQWSDIDQLPDATARSCSDILAGIGTPVFPRVIVTPDRVSLPNYGWVEFANGTKQWVDATCRQQLSDADVPLSVLEWADIDAISDAPPVSCDAIVDPSSPEPSLPQLLVTADRSTQGYGWVQFVDGTKQWVNSQCRAQLVDRGMQTSVKQWADITIFPDRPAIPCADITIGSDPGDDDVIVIYATPDRQSVNQYAWAVIDGKAKSFIEGQCRSSLTGLGVSTRILPWDAFGEIPDTPMNLTCDELTDRLGDSDDSTGLYAQSLYEIGAFEGVFGDLAVADVDGDGLLDMIASTRVADVDVLTAYYNDGGAEPFASEGSAEFIAGPFTMSENSPPPALAAGDVNGDGRVDLVVGRFNLPNLLYLNDGSTRPFSADSEPVQITDDVDFTSAVALSDVDADGDLDLIAAAFIGERLYINDGSDDPFGALEEGRQLNQVNSSSSDIALADINSDGHVDIVFTGRTFLTASYGRTFLNDGSATPFLGQAAQHFGTVTSNADSSPKFVLADVTNDGLIDYVSTNSAASAFREPMSYFAGNGVDGVFIDPSAEPTRVFGLQSDEAFVIGVADVDGDGDTDVVAGNRDTTSKLYVNNGTSQPFGRPADLNPLESPESGLPKALEFADLDNDGDLDLIIGRSTEQGVIQIFLNSLN